MQHGASRREAIRQVTRENMDAEVREGVSETLQQGRVPGCARVCSVFCGALMVVLLVAAVLSFVCVCAGCGVLHLLGWLMTWRR